MTLLSNNSMGNAVALVAVNLVCRSSSLFAGRLCALHWWRRDGAWFCVVSQIRQDSHHTYKYLEMHALCCVVHCQCITITSTISAMNNSIDTSGNATTAKEEEKKYYNLFLFCRLIHPFCSGSISVLQQQNTPRCLFSLTAIGAGEDDVDNDDRHNSSNRIIRIFDCSFIERQMPPQWQIHFTLLKGTIIFYLCDINIYWRRAASSLARLLFGVFLLVFQHHHHHHNIYIYIQFLRSFKVFR